jgi:hypothetical protein
MHPYIVLELSNIFCRRLQNLIVLLFLVPFHRTRSGSRQSRLYWGSGGFRRGGERAWLPLTGFGGPRDHIETGTDKTCPRSCSNKLSVSGCSFRFRVGWKLGKEASADSNGLRGHVRRVLALKFVNPTESLKVQVTMGLEPFENECWGLRSHQAGITGGIQLSRPGEPFPRQNEAHAR